MWAYIRLIISGGLVFKHGVTLRGGLSCPHTAGDTRSHMQPHTNGDAEETPHYCTMSNGQELTQNEPPPE